MALSLYVDDGLIFASSPSWTHVQCTLQDCFALTYDWLSRAGLSLESSKTELIYFCRSKDKIDPPLHLLLPDHSISSYVTIAPSPIVQYLGFYLHHKLDWKHHVQVMANRTRASLRAVKVLGNSIQGLNLADWRLLYHVIALPTLSYGSQLWWAAPKKQTLINILRTAQNVGLRLITGAFHTTLVEPLHALARVLPIHVYLEKLASNSALCLLHLPSWALPLQLLGHPWHTPSPSDFKPPVPKHRTCCSVNRSALTCLAARLDPALPRFDPHLITSWTDFPWANRVSIMPSAKAGPQCRWTSDLLTTYEDGRAAITLLAAHIATDQSDGLLIGGAAATHFRPGGSDHLSHWTLGTGVLPFDALTRGATLATQFALSTDFLLDPYYDDPGITMWYLIFPDEGAMQAMLMPRSPSAARASVPFLWHLDHFLTKQPTFQIKICWGPPDCDSPWISEVCKLAGQASHGGTRGLIPHVPSEAHYRQSTSEIAMSQWQAHWKSLRPSRHYPVTQAVLTPQATPYPLWLALHPKRSQHGSSHNLPTGLPCTSEEGQTQSAYDDHLTPNPPFGLDHTESVRNAPRPSPDTGPATPLAHPTLGGQMLAMERTPAPFHPNHRPPIGGHPRSHPLGRRCATAALRLATGHSFTGDYAKRFLQALPPQSHSCPCGTPLRTAFHLLYKCPRHLAARFASGLISKGSTQTFQSLFHTKTGAHALLNFLALSGATFQPEEGPVWDQPWDPN